MQRLWAACAPPGWGQPGASPWRQPPGEAFPSPRWPRFLCGPGRAARACCAGWVPALRQTSQEALWRFSSSRCSFLDNRPATGIRTGESQGHPAGLPWCSEGKASARYAGDPGSIPGSGRSPGEGNGNPLQYSCLGNPLARGAWRATVHGAQSLTRLSDFFLPPGASAPCPGAAPPPPARRERSGSRRR